MTPLLETQQLSVGYREGKRETVLLHDLNLRLDAGEFVAILGQNGAGKSTLLRALTCSTSALAGKLLLEGKPVETVPMRKRSQLIGLVSTERPQAGALTVTELVGLGRQPHTGFLGRLSSEDHDIINDAIAQVGITHKSSSYIAQLSDGERQKVMIAKALAQQTPVIVLDEPTAFLDAASRIEVMMLLNRLAHEQGKAILLSTHDISRSLLLTDRLWIITKERTVIDGPTEEVVASQAMNQVFSNPNITFNPKTCDYEATKP